MSSEELSFDAVRQTAEDAARELWVDFISSEDVCPLRSEVIRYGSAWMFFRSDEVKIPEQRPLMDGAVVVSSKGEVRHTVSYFPDLNECMQYLMKMSEHFEERGL